MTDELGLVVPVLSDARAAGAVLLALCVTSHSSAASNEAECVTVPVLVVNRSLSPVAFLNTSYAAALCCTAASGLLRMAAAKGFNFEAKLAAVVPVLLVVVVVLPCNALAPLHPSP